MARKAKLKQKHFKGMEPPSIPAIDQAAEEYADIRDSRMELTKEEVELQEKLKELMEKHKLTSYEYDGNLVTISADTKVKVKKKKQVPLDEE